MTRIKSSHRTKNRFISLGTILLLLSESGCATLVSDEQQVISVHSEPSGASIMADEHFVGVTPASVRLNRKRPQQIRIVKEGYQEVILQTRKGVNWAVMGNVLFGGIPGLFIDFLTGAAYSVHPKEINAHLTKT